MQSQLVAKWIVQDGRLVVHWIVADAENRILYLNPQVSSQSKAA